MQAVSRDHVDLDAQQISQRQPEPDLIEHRGFVGELDQQVDIGPWLIITASDRAEDPRFCGVVLSDEVAYGFAVLCDANGGTYLESATDPLQYCWGRRPPPVLIGREVGL